MSATKPASPQFSFLTAFVLPALFIFLVPILSSSFQDFHDVIGDLG